MSEENFNGRIGVKWTTLIPFIIIAGGGLVTWGETRYRLNDAYAQIEQVEEEYKVRIKEIETNQKDVEESLNDITVQQAVTSEQIKELDKKMEKQDDKLDLILQRLGKNQ